MFSKLLISFTLVVFLSACGTLGGKSDEPQVTKEPPAQIEYLTADGKIYKVETNVGSKDWADAQIAKSNADCWIGISKKTESSLQLPANADVMTIMAFGMVESNRALASAITGNNSPDNPCQLASNSNDVEIAKDQGKTKRTETRWQSAPKLLGITAAAALGINSQNTSRDIAVAGVDALGKAASAGIAKAGNNVQVTGDGNDVNATSQTADNGSSISESGNFEPNNSESVANTDSEEPNPEDFDSSWTNRQKCEFWNGDYVELDDRCSNGEGGTIDFETGELI